jgi:hypothetical protein
VQLRRQKMKARIAVYEAPSYLAPCDSPELAIKYRIVYRDLPGAESIHAFEEMGHVRLL